MTSRPPARGGSRSDAADGRRLDTNTVSPYTADVAAEPLAADAAAALLGIVMLLPADRAAGHCAHLDALDFTDPRHRVVFELIADLAERGVDPGPAAVLAEARATGVVGSSHRLTALSLLLIDLVRGAPAAPMAAWFSRAVLELALRRRVVEAAGRIRQAVDECGTADMLAVVEAEHAAVLASAARWRGSEGGRS